MTATVILILVGALLCFRGAASLRLTVMAAGFVVTVPLIILVLVFQRRIVAGLTAGGVKG